MTSRARPGISKGLLAQLIALVRADEAGSVGDETEMVDLGGIAAAAVAERVPAALAAGVDIQLERHPIAPWSLAARRECGALRKGLEWIGDGRRECRPVTSGKIPAEVGKNSIPNQESVSAHFAP